MPTGSRPFGDIYTIPTSAVDQISAHLYQQQQQKAAEDRQNNKMLDEEFAKNLSGIRDADIPDLTKAYGDYKQAAIGLQKKGQSASTADQFNVLKKKADMYSVMNESKQQKLQEEQAASQVIKNPNNYDDNAHSFLIARRNTPVKQFNQTITDPSGNQKNVDMTDIWGNISYKQGTTDYTAAISKAKGTPAVRGISTSVKSPDGLSTTSTTYKAGNSPMEYLQALQGSVVGSQKTKNLPLEFNYSDEEANKIITDYSALRQTPEFKAAYPNEPEIPAHLMATPTGRAMGLMAMENALLHPPIAVEGKPEIGKGALMDRQYKEWLAKNKITSSEANYRTFLNLGKTEVTPNQIPNPIEGYKAAATTVTPPKSLWSGKQADPYLVIEQNKVSPEHVKQLGNGFDIDGKKQYKIITINGEDVLQSPKSAIRASEMQNKELKTNYNTSQEVRNQNKKAATVKPVTNIKKVTIKGL